MKIIVLLSFFGIVTNAFRFLPNGITRCLYLYSKTDLDTDKFFTGRWHVTHAKNGSRSAVCREYTASKAGGFVELIGDGYYNVGLKRNYLQVDCRGCAKKNQFNQFTLNCTQKIPSSDPYRFIVDFGLELTVIETDYDSFAIIYMCTMFPQLGSFFNDDLLILHRDKRMASYPDPQVEAFLQAEYKFQLKSFRVRDNNYCLNLSI
uniref:Pc150, similar to triabin-like lipocalin 4a n=1 Tax=Panstrongylus chinai TaxID=156444 RepID=A0A286P0W7_9HEMI|nr:Pc150, similar to triabin-like lipocalin 4a [Panstrongylus chinai]